MLHAAAPRPPAGARPPQPSCGPGLCAEAPGTRPAGGPHRTPLVFTGRLSVLLFRVNKLFIRRPRACRWACAGAPPQGPTRQLCHRRWTPSWACPAQQARTWPRARRKWGTGPGAWPVAGSVAGGWWRRRRRQHRALPRLMSAAHSWGRGASWGGGWAVCSRSAVTVTAERRSVVARVCG